MTTPHHTPVTRTPANIDGAPTLLFIHGFLDDAAVWEGVIAALDHELNTVRYDLPGFGPRAATIGDPDALSLESLAAEAGEILNGIDTPVIVVGQSMGSQIAEIVAAEHPDQVDGLVLLTPVPLGRLERRRGPEPVRAGWLHIVMGIQQYRGGPWRARRGTEHRGIRAVDLQQSDALEPRGLQPFGGRVRRLPYPGSIEAGRANRRYADELLKLAADAAERRLNCGPNIRQV